MNYLIVSILLAFTAFSGTFMASKTESKMTITGTSSIHDWESVVSDFTITGTWTSTSVTGVKGSASVKSIQSGKSIMDKKTFDALKSDAHPQITLQADQLTVSGKKVTGTATLRVAGVAKKVNIDATILSDAVNELKLSGKIGLKMTDFGIEPPTAMFGALHTGDEISVNYTLVLTK